MRHELQENTQKRATAAWLDELIGRISDGLTEGTYQVLPLSAEDLEMLKQEPPEIGCLLNLMGRKTQQDDVIWIDDRWANAYIHVNGTPIIGINEVLKVLVGVGALKDREYYAKVSQLRAANIRFIPFEADEILYLLRQARIDQNKGVIENRELTILRRYMAACLFQGKSLQQPPVPENIPNKHGEMMFPFNIERAIFGSLVGLWESEKKEEIRYARAEWIMRNLYVDTFGWGNLISLPGIKQQEHDFVAFGPIGLIVRAMNLGSTESNRKQGLRRQFFDWLFQRVLQTRFEIDPELIKTIAENLKTLLLDNANQAPGTDSEQDITWWIVQQFYLDLPRPIQEELAHDIDFMTKIGVTPAFDVGDVSFRPDEFFEAAYKVINGKKARITPIEAKKYVTFHPSRTSEKRHTFYFYHSRTGEKTFEKYEGFEILLDSVEQREVFLRRHRQLFDCPAKEFEEEVTRIVLLEDHRRRFEAVETWKNSSVVLFYNRLSRELRSHEPLQAHELVPQHIDGLLRHLRLNPDIESGEAFQEALYVSAQALIDEEDIFTVITRFVGLPVVLPPILIESIAESAPQERQTLLERLFKSCHSPISKFHLVYILIHIDEDSPIVYRLICELISPAGAEHFEAWLAVLTWTHEEFNRRAEVWSWPVHIRLALTWAHAQQLFEIFIAVGWPAIELQKLFSTRIRRHRVSFEFFEREPSFWCDVSHPQQLRLLPFLFCGLAYGLDGHETSIISEELWKGLAGMVFSKEEGIRQAALPLLRDVRQAQNSLNAFLGRDRGEVLSQLIGPDIGVNFGHAALQKLVEQQLEILSGTKDDFAPWGILREVFADSPLPDKLSERLAPIIEQTDFVQLCERNVITGTAITEAASILLRNLHNEELRLSLKKQVIKIAQLYSLRQEEREYLDKISYFLVEYSRNLALAAQPPLDVVDEFVDILTQLVEICDFMDETTRDLILTLMDELPIAQSQKFWPLLVRLRAS